MSHPRICILGSLEAQLITYLTGHPDGHERAAVVLFRRYHSNIAGLSDSDRYVAVEVHPFEDDMYTSSSREHYAFCMQPLRKFYQRCEAEGLVFGIAHNHPSGIHSFSDRDAENEKTILRGISNRNGKDIHLVALMLCEGKWYGQVRHGLTPEIATDVRHIVVLSENMDIHSIQESVRDIDEEIWARQAAAFGKPFVAKLKSLRVAIVGCSGTGGPMVTMLARSGVSDLILIDQDRLEGSNLNRVRGSKKDDIGKNKAAIARDFVHSLGLDAHAVAIDALIDESPDSVDALATCDVVFGCTDDHLGRQALNAAVSIYGIAYIDVGVGGKVAQDANGKPQIVMQKGRVSVVLPEHGCCLFCQYVTSTEKARNQQALRDNPDITEEEKKERYLEGGAEDSPGIGPFTSSIAELGIATFYDLVQPYRQLPQEWSRDHIYIDFLTMKTGSRVSSPENGCVYCDTREAKLKSTNFRLGRPILGEHEIYV